MDWPTDSDDSDSLPDDDRKMELKNRDNFLKKAKVEEEDGEKKRTTTKKGGRSRDQKKKQEDDSDEEDDAKEDGWQSVSKKAAIPREKPKMFGKDDEITIPSVVKKLTEIMAARGKKGTDRREQIELLHELFKIAKETGLGSALQIKIQFNIIMSIYDYNPSVSDPMKVELWEKILVKIDELLDMLMSTADLSIGEHITDEGESLEEAPFKVRGCVLTIVERMDEEFVKLLK
ncbi:UNVERIFIED_CONTAM: hypothetical protein GTU68_022836, partial [Idotea baltica]|nr:hypothetical protein [Idotea baltica]